METLNCYDLMETVSWMLYMYLNIIIKLYYNITDIYTCINLMETHDKPI